MTGKKAKELKTRPSCAVVRVWPAEPVRQGRAETQRPASGSGKHAAEHMTEKPKGYESKPEVRLREGREVFRGQGHAMSGQRGRPQRQSPGKG